MKEVKEFVIGSFLANSEGYLKMRNLLGLMFEVSFVQAEKIEDKKLMEDKRWIVYSWDIKLDEPIKAGDRIEIATFSVGMKKFYAYRNFTIKRNDKTIGLAYCVFLLFDLKKLRPIKVPKTLEEAYQSEKAIYLGQNPDYSEGFEFSKKIYIRKNDIDGNYHVNNAAYMDIIREISNIKDQDIGYLKIVYKNEIRKKDYVIGKLSNKKLEESFKLVDDNDKTYSYGKIVKRNV